MPSIEEGCAYSPIEAMSCGVPLILTNHTGSAELITEGKEGFVIPIRRPDLIARHILQLYQNPPLNEWMGLNARKLVDEKLDWSHYAKRLMAVYDTLLK
jgi:glycosyltransferase involved in cell wall biosynthesis